MKKDFNVQVEKEHYQKDYDTLLRFISYFYQIDIVRKLKPNKILEIGIGNKTLSNYLRQNGFNLTTCDFDEKLNPDYTADVRKLPFKDNSYDTVLAFEILEHLPWKDSIKALSELHRVTKGYLIISLPYYRTSFEFLIKFPLITKIFKMQYLNIFFRIPYLFDKPITPKQHYWEIGLKNYSIRKIRKTFSEKFEIVKEVRPILNSYHQFFILKKK